MVLLPLDKNPLWPSSLRFKLILFFALIFSLLIFSSLFSKLFKTPETNPPDTPTSELERTLKSETRLILTGDVMLGRNVEIMSREVGDFSYPFEKVADRLKNADIVFINLENPIVKNCPTHNSGFTFCATPEMIAGLVFSGVDVVNLANNHSGNYGQVGLNQSVENLAEKEILTTGLGKLITLERDGMIFGFLGFDFTVKSPIKADYELIKSSDSQVDFLIVGVHWGVEYTDKPTESQRIWAKQMVEAGADVIAGHHPHWVQESEFIEGKPVYYSLGNFVFDQMWSEETRKGLVVALTFKGGFLQAQEFFPIYIQNWAQPKFVND